MLSLLLGLLSIAAVLPASNAKYYNSSQPFGPLKFQADGTFQISIFEDLHFGESTCWPTFKYLGGMS